MEKLYEEDEDENSDDNDDIVSDDCSDGEDYEYLPINNICKDS